MKARGKACGNLEERAVPAVLLASENRGRRSGPEEQDPGKGGGEELVQDEQEVARLGMQRSSCA